MKTNALKVLALKLHSLAVFRSLLDDNVIKALLYYLDNKDTLSATDAVDAYSAFVSALFESHNYNLTEYIRDKINNDENVYIIAKGASQTIPPHLEECVNAELEILNETAALNSEILRSSLEWQGYLPDFGTSEINIISEYYDRIKNIEKYGYGIYSKYHMFWINAQNRIVPVRNPDSTCLCDLINYKNEQQIILENTKALLCGKPAANVLLTGDAGTGKSSTVKAIANELYRDGLRIIEVRKEQLREIPQILDELSVNPLKFILFIDDLSFQKDDDNFSALKAILEGSVSSKSKNVVIYATSNRRHLVKETFKSREGDEIHLNDTVQEIISLSERFGIQLTFSRPDKKTFLDIVFHLAEKNNIQMSSAELELLAERFALSKGTRSARAAKQFVDSLISKEQ